MHVSVIYGSVRSERKGIRLARMMVDAVDAAGDTATLVDPAEWALPLLDRRIFEFAADEAPQALRELSAIFRGSDAFIFVTGEYNHCIPPALKNIFDHFSPKEFGDRPSGIASYSTGRFGGVRAAEQIRLMVPGLGGITIPTALSIPFIVEAIDPDGTPRGDDLPKLAQAFLAELRSWVKERRGDESG